MKKLLLVGLALSLTAYAQTGAQSGTTSSSGPGAGSGSQGSGYAPNDGSAKPGNPGTFATPNAGLGNSAPETTTRGTDVNGAETMGTGASPSSGMNPSRTNDVTGSDQATTMQSGNADPDTEANENLERSNTSANPIPTDTTLQSGKTQTGPYKTPGNKQSQEAEEEELDYRAIPQVDHNDQNASENQ